MDDTRTEPAAERLARLFHEVYEELAPSFGYETRQESRKPWADVPTQNKALMIAVCDRILDEWAINGVDKHGDYNGGPASVPAENMAEETMKLWTEDEFVERLRREFAALQADIDRGAAESAAARAEAIEILAEVRAKDEARSIEIERVTTGHQPTDDGLVTRHVGYRRLKRGRNGHRMP